MLFENTLNTRNYLSKLSGLHTMHEKNEVTLPKFEVSHSHTQLKFDLEQRSKSALRCHDFSLCTFTLTIANSSCEVW